ncbi:MAG TPA: cytochrome c3 family protein, partial [Solirubrobacter sp.]
VAGNDVKISFNVKVNGVDRDDFTRSASVVRNHNEDAYWVYVGTPPEAAPVNAGVRTKIPLGSWTIASNRNGNYTVTLPGLATSTTFPAPVAGAAYMLSVMNPQGVTATAVAYYQSRTHDLVSNKACINCHGNLIWRDAVHDVTYPQGIDPCIVCHNRTGAADPRLPGAGSGLMGIAHGIHNSKNMPDGQYTFTWASNGNKFNFSIGFPGFMNNCVTCHDTAQGRAAVASAPVSYGLCISCHDGWDGFPATVAGGTFAFHRDYDGTTDCSLCHNATSGIPATIAGFHDGLVTERAGLIWDGADQSVVLAPTIQLELTGVAVTTKDVQVTWTAKDAGGTLYDPCNSDYAKGPVFFGATGTGSSEGCTNSTLGCASNMSILRSYAQADDWVNDAYPGGSSPGQPKSTNLAASNTKCAEGVATTKVPLQSTAAARGIVALQGKPQVKWAPTNTIIWVRSQTPTREFVVSDGSLPTAQRRTIVDVNKCNACHLGSLYQHGGSRVDKIELCVMCHNPSSSEQNNRVGMGVTAATAYDGKAGETYDLRTLVHAVHSAGETQVPLLYYRSNGIFFFGAKGEDGKLLGVTNWPDEAGCVKCVDPEDGPLTWCKVHGSSATGEDYSGARAADGSCKPASELPPSTDATWRPHRVREIHYSRPLNDCGACHVNDTDKSLPDPTRAVAVTFDAGKAPWNDLLDDKLVSPSTATCLSCHQSKDDVQQFFLREHAYKNSWAPSAFVNGRQTLLDALP